MENRGQGWKQRTSQGAPAVVQETDDDCKPGGSSEGGGKPANSDLLGRQSWQVGLRCLLAKWRCQAGHQREESRIKGSV